MKIDLKLGPNADWQTVDCERGMTLEQIYCDMTADPGLAGALDAAIHSDKAAEAFGKATAAIDKAVKAADPAKAAKLSDAKKKVTKNIFRNKAMENRVMVAKVDNRYVSLDYAPKKNVKVEFLDISTHNGRLVFQHGMIMVYLKAIEETLGRSHVEVQYALSKGLYTEIDGGRMITDEEFDRIKVKMEELVEKDIPFVMGVADRETALEAVERAGLTEKKRLLEGATNVKRVNYFMLDGFYNLFYGPMVPSTGYIKGFDLMRYRKGILLMLPRIREGSGLAYIDDRKLYSAFEETQKWQRLLEVPYVKDLNLKIDNGEEKDMIQLSEALHEQKIIELAQRIVKERKRVILISGPSSSGKTTFARRLCIQLRVNGLSPLYMGTDDYFLDRDLTPVNAKGEKDYECLEAVDVELFNQNMNDLLSGKQADLPTFDFIEGKKIFGKRITSIKPGTPIVIEGIHALNKKFTPKIDDKEKFKIYISPLTQLNIDNHNRISITDSRLLRRIVRDYQFRGYSAEKTIKAWPNVRAGENVNVFPYNGEADVFINSMHVYEIGILKKYATPLLEEITQESEQYAEAERLLTFLKFFHVIEHDEYVPNNSLLREFIGGSIFV